ncbi:MAG TPA: hypothetical protein VLU43_10575 [Anaeromyxobacteraceae bacterium]|nr:hypothetical protein [Anaeromyxobacteraceae bacterium]
MKTTSQLRLRLAAAALAFAASGCTYFTTTKRVDMTPFADNTIKTIGEMGRLSKPPIWVHLRRFRQSPAVVRTLEDNIPVRKLLRNIAFYSAQVVSLNDSALPEKKKIKELVRYMREVVKPAVEDSDAADWGVTIPDLDPILDQVTKKETFLEALGALEPLVNAVLQYGLKLQNRVDGDITTAGEDVDRQIDVEFTTVIENANAIEAVQQRTLRGLALLFRYRLGDAAALKELKEEVPSARELLGSPVPSGKDLAAVEATLAAQLDRLKAAREQLAPDLADYRDSKVELDTLRVSVLEYARTARITLILWARSHRNLGRGVAVPPVIDVTGLLMGAASKAAGALIP